MEPLHRVKLRTRSALAEYVPNILQQLPLIFDHVIDIESHSSLSGTWPDKLINLIDMYSSPNLSKTIAKIFPPARGTIYDDDKIKKLNSGIQLYNFFKTDFNSLTSRFKLALMTIVNRTIATIKMLFSI